MTDERILITFDPAAPPEPEPTPAWKLRVGLVLFGLACGLLAAWLAIRGWNG